VLWEFGKIVVPWLVDPEREVVPAERPATPAPSKPVVSPDEMLAPVERSRTDRGPTEDHADDA